MTLAETFANALPTAFFLDADNVGALQDYLHRQGVLSSERTVVSLQRAGDGNMNLVLRARLDDGHTLIVKQSRPWAEKFPDIPAPANRADIEGQYYQLLSRHTSLERYSPTLLLTDPQSHILVMEDLGTATDLSTIYKPGQTLHRSALDALAAYLSELHGTVTRSRTEATIDNREMRALNAVHIFEYPFSDSTGFDLDAITPGLAAVGGRVRNDAGVMRVIDALHTRYLADGDTLVHGDFYPGSVLQTEDGVRVIDPEFCFFGDAELDVGVFYAHLILAQQPADVLDRWLRRYESPSSFSLSLCHAYAGVEVLRRLLGLAQLPVSLDIDGKRACVTRACQMLTDARL